MLFTIKEVKEMHSDKAGEYLQILGFTGDGKPSTKNIFNSMKDKWPILKEDATVELKMQKKGEFWNVVDITDPGLPPVVEEAIKDKGTTIASVTNKPQGKYRADPDKTASIELQVCLKVAGEIAVALINAGILKEKVVEKTLSTAKDFASLFNENS